MCFHTVMVPRMCVFDIFFIIIIFTVICREGQTRRERECKGMLTYPSDPLPDLVCPMDEDTIPPNRFCSAPSLSELPPPHPPLSSITPRYSCPCTFCFLLLLVYFPLHAFYTLFFLYGPNDLGLANKQHLLWKSCQYLITDHLHQY